MRPLRRSMLKRTGSEADSEGVKRSMILLAALLGLLCAMPAGAAASSPPGCSNHTHQLCAGVLMLGLAEGEDGEEETEAEAAEGKSESATESEEAEAEEAEEAEEREAEEEGASTGAPHSRDRHRGSHGHGAKGRRNSKHDAQKLSTGGHRKPKPGSHRHGKHKGRVSSHGSKR